MIGLKVYVTCSGQVPVPAAVSGWFTTCYNIKQKQAYIITYI